MQFIIILKLFKEFFACKTVLAANHHFPENVQIFFACKIVLDANHHYPEIIQRFFRLQNCLSRTSSLSWKYSKTFSPAKLSSKQITIILKIFKDFFACNFVLHANHHYPGNIQRLFLLQIVLAANHHYPEIIPNLSRLQSCLRRKSSLSRNYSKIFSPAKMSQTQIIFILKLFNELFACKVVLAANHFVSEIIQRLFRLPNCLGCNSSLS